MTNRNKKYIEALFSLAGVSLDRAKYADPEDLDNYALDAIESRNYVALLVNRRARCDKNLFGGRNHIEIHAKEDNLFRPAYINQDFKTSIEVKLLKLQESKDRISLEYLVGKRKESNQYKIKRTVIVVNPIIRSELEEVFRK